MKIEVEDKTGVYHCVVPEFRINVGCEECKQHNCRVRDNQKVVK